MPISKLSDDDKEWVWGIAALQAERKYRKWTDKTDKHSIDAALVEYAENHVTLELKNAFSLTVPFENLSVGDQDYLKSVPTDIVISIDDY